MNSNDELQDLAIKIGQVLTEIKKSVSTAESCTGGWVGKEFTGIPGSSNWYGFGFITYSNRAKLKSLGVSKDAFLDEGALRNSGSDFTISISGIAGPTGGTDDKPVGTVCFGIGSQDNINCFTEYFEGDRDEVRKQSVAFALKELLKCLQ